MMKAFFASTARGLEELLKSELTELGAQACRVAQGGVYFEASEPQMYSILLWTRLASRIFLPLTTFTLDSDEQLYHAAREVEWDTHFNVSNSFVVNVTGTNKAIRNSQYGALKVKDAIVDYFLARDNKRPDIEKQWPDIRLNLFIDRQQATLSLDLSGESLHHRGYRQSAGQAPIKENLAAAIILRSGWKRGMPLLDPLCGSGTLLIEAAFMALDMAPGLLREYWGFNHWKQHQAELWQQVLTQAKERAHQGQQLASSLPQFFGFDYDEQVINKANMNAKRAGVSSLITFKVQEITQLNNPYPSTDEKGVIVSNPPYGERLGSEPALVALHSVLGQRLKHFFHGWAISLFSASPELLTCLQLRADKQFKAKNGPLDCIQKNYKLSDRVPDEPLLPLDASLIHNTQTQEGSQLEYAPDFANRLRKNLQKFDKWAKREGVDCYRIYDADLPEYNVAIDRYGDFVVVQEYAAPKTIDPQRVRQRLFDVINATLKVLEIPSSQLILKVRERQKGKKQYQKLAQKGSNLLVHEYNAKFWVNLTDYLDTGLFLDHRLARRMIGQMSKGKDFLNLFAYTGTATIHAALGGAKSTTTVDMSYTYLEWAEKNLDLNELFGNEHRLIQADCLNWLKHCQEQFDLIFIDPPTFSNSKRMEESFDVQRDHLDLMQDLKRILRDDGTLIFSNNKRGFKMDYEGLSEMGLSAEDITTKTISLDFSRRQNIHQCWLIRHC